MSTEDEIIAHYEKYTEAERLTQDIGPLELARTQDLIRRYLPPLPAVVLDVGGGPGVYSFWLAGLGFAVHLVDIVPRHIAQAVAAQKAGAPSLAGMAVGDARRLDFGDSCAGLVILHGPLYHLSERADRLRAIREARRVLLPGGRLLAFGITRYAGLIYGLQRGLVFDPAYLEMIRTEVGTGLRTNPPPGTFTLPNAYFHLPGELSAELVEGGLVCEGVLGVLGPAWQVPDLDTAWQDETRRQVLLDIARMTENEPLLGPRLMAVGRKAGR